MKKILLSVFTFFAVSTAFAQSFEVHDVAGNDVSGTTIHVWEDSANLMDVHLEILNTNTSSPYKLAYAKRRVNYHNIPNGFNYFCWTICYSPMVDTSLTSDTLYSMQPYTKFHGYMNPNNSSGETSITYTVYDADNVSDSTWVTIVYHADVVGIDDVSASGENKISAAAPNPANNFTNLSYSLKNNVQTGRIVVYNMLGELIKEVRLDEKQGTIKLNLAGMNTGVYFYSLVADDKVISTRKLVVSH